ncbi:MAG TPA: GGDEF domain-containing protein [Actinobacteria bacterium]|nr:GGDEF domain-containing protein [Actinomycetota bacterium]
MTIENKDAGEKKIEEKNKGVIFIVRFVLKLILVIFLAELLIMILLVCMPPLPQYLWPLFDAALLILVISPALYWFIYRPMTKEISELHEVEHNLFKSKSTLEAVFQSCGEGIRSIDLNFRIVDQNREMNLLCGLENNAKAKGRKCSELFGDSRCGTDKCTIRRILSGENRLKIEAEKVAKDGKIIITSIVATPLRNKKGEIVGVIESFRDITERKKIEREKERLSKKLAFQARIDGLTKIFNRQTLDRELRNEILRAKRYDSPLSIIMLDIDNFKKVNDACGHQVGDVVLKKIVRSIKKAIRETDFVGRYGGEEFLVVCVETEMNEAFGVAERVQEEIKKVRLKDKNGLPIAISASLGVSELNKAEDMDMFITRADDALYLAKSEGRDRVCCSK